MPEYTYRCPSCDERFSVKKSISQAKSPECCPSCGADARRTWTAPAISTGSSGGGSYVPPAPTCSTGG